VNKNRSKEGSSGRLNVSKSVNKDCNLTNSYSTTLPFLLFVNPSVFWRCGWVTSMGQKHGHIHRNTNEFYWVRPPSKTH